MDLQLQADLDDVQRRNAEARDQASGPAGQHDLALGTFIFEMFTPSRHIERKCQEEESIVEKQFRLLLFFNSGRQMEWRIHIRIYVRSESGSLGPGHLDA